MSLNTFFQTQQFLYTGGSFYAINTAHEAVPISRALCLIESFDGSHSDFGDRYTSSKR